MKTVGAVKHKLGQVRFRHLKRRLETELRQTPSNCLYNSVLPEHYVSGQPAVGICTFGVATADSTWPLSVCDEHVDGGTRARGCGKFCPRMTKDEIKEDFQQRLDAMSLPEVAAHYPDMAALIWVLDAGDVEDVPVAEPAANPDAASGPPIIEMPIKPWYVRLMGL